MNIKFEKINDEWFVDLPAYLEEGGSMADLQMVFGADAMLDILSEGLDEVTVEIGSEGIELNRLSGDDSGAFYAVNGLDDFEASKWAFVGIWLCPVTKWLFGEYPLKMYIKKIS